MYLFLDGKSLRHIKYICMYIYGHIHKDVSTFYHPNAYRFSTIKAGTLKNNNNNKRQNKPKVKIAVNTVHALDLL